MITFTLTVTNQGNVDAYSIGLSDNIPVGTTLADANWTDNGGVADLSTLIAGPLAPGATTTVDITFLIDADFMGSSIMNSAQISEADDDTDPNNDPPEDVDSDPDNDDGDQSEDDEDPETVPIGQSFDLALVKMLDANQPMPIYPGDDVTYNITVTNQGTLDAYNIEVVDYIPSGMLLNDPTWSLGASPNTAYQTYAGPLVPGASQVFTIVLQVDPNYSGGDLQNFAEISEADDDTDPNNDPPTDVDSEPDDDDSNDGDYTDNDTDNTDGDEDDHDPEEISVDVFDLALEKDISAAQVLPIAPGDMITFTLTVTNQGTIDAYTIGLSDVIPTGTTLVDADWTDNGGVADLNIPIPGPLAAGASTTVDITFMIDADFMGSTIMNSAEITEADDDTDPDNDPPNDQDSDPDNDDGDQSEDDEDPETVPIGQVFDLALVKMLAPTQAVPVAPGDLVDYIITVYNQGTLDAYSIEVVDYIPAGMLLSDASWTPGSAPNTAYQQVAGPIVPGDSVQLTLTLQVDPNYAGGSLQNFSEISEADDDTDPNNDPPTDEDSTPDDDNSNDGPYDDDTTDGSSGDEDDHDPADILVQVFDLALDKSVSPTQPLPITPGDDITFDIEICNQGTVDGYNVGLTDVYPNSTTLSVNDANGWVDNADGTASMTFAGPVAVDMCQTVQIVLTLDQNAAPGSFENTVEIDGAEDEDGNPQDDIDSDGGNDDGDQSEDDEDNAPFEVEVFDLALIKVLDPNQTTPVYPGDDVTFNITVFNQGSIDAYNIDVVDYIPAGFVLNDANWVGAPGNTAITTIQGPISAGEDLTISITLTVTPDVTAGNTTNTAEISDAEDEDGNHPEDEDSNPDDDPDNETGEEDDATDGTNGDEDDSDPADVPVAIFDLALEKALAPGQPAIVGVGDIVTFQIQVFNQGSVDAFNVDVVDYIPVGMSLADASWTAGAGNSAYQTIAGPIAAGSSAIVTIDVMVDILPASGVFENFAEISDAEDEDGNHPEDADSTPDDDNSNDGPVNDGDTMGGGPDEGEDEDDHDPAYVGVAVFDLALEKELSATQPMPIRPGDDISFDIEICNQGTIDGYNVGLTDVYPPSTSLSSSDTNGWVDNADGTASMTFAGPVVVNECETVQIVLTLDPSATPGTFENVVEIDGAEDENGNPQDDTDSDGGNDDGDQSEDDEDNAPFTIETFDLALVKMLDPNQPTPVYPGDDVTFVIEVFNQGTIDAYNVDVTDYIPAGFVLNDTDWVPQSGNTALYTIPGPITGGNSISIPITLTVTPGVTAGNSTNTAEISDAEDEDGNHPEDEDSTADDDPDNETGEEDDVTDGTNGDEDDSDPADVPVAVFDLALEKTLAPGQDAVVGVGDDVTFQIEIFNQGSVDAYNVDIVDYIPTGMSLNDPNWTPGSGSSNNAYTTIAGPIAAGGSSIVTITVTVDVLPASGVFENTAEISDAEDEDGNHPEDQDSNADDDDSNDGPVSDGDTMGGGPDEGEDEDDSDPAYVGVATFDLALQKMLSPDQPLPITPGDDITFDIEICNQGTIDGYNIVLTDVLPASTNLSSADNNGWVQNPGGTATMTFAGPVLVNECQTVQIVLTLNSAATSGSYENTVEIDSATDEDGDPQEDTDSEGGNDDGDQSEDDEDNAPFEVEVFDLALVKTLSPIQAVPVTTGDDVVFLIEVFNQGTIDAYDVEVTDYIPAGFVLNDNDWLPVSASTAVITIDGPIQPGDSEIVSITLTVTSASAGNAVNTAEISDAEDEDGNHPEDIDSTPDDDPNNETGEEDDVTDGTNGDEDDSDPASVPVTGSFDLALTKTLAPGENGQVSPGETVTFVITVINQGGVDAYNVEVVDYLPTGLTLADSDWATSTVPSEVFTTIPGPIVAGTSATVEITLLVDASFEGTAINYSEIADAEDEDGNHPVDVDSSPDDDNTNDGPISDNDTDGTNGDEDDHDPESIVVGDFDLALTKVVSPSQTFPVYPGDDVTFTITVYNQGDFDAYAIDIVDYIPADMTLNDADWTDNNDGTAIYTIAGPLVVGDDISIDVTMTIDPSFTGNMIDNTAEIAAADDDTDPNNNPPVDSDSTPDDTEGNDGPMDDDTIDGSNGDEDDSDPASFPVGQPFDLALTKVLSSSQVLPVNAGDLITFTINVINQGEIDAYNIEVTDILPQELVLADSDWTDNNDGTASIVIAGPLTAGSSTSVDITLVIRPGFTGTSVTNEAEISAADDDTNPNNDPPIDSDSTPDADNTNDGPETDNATDGTDGDEDDSDPETVVLGEEIEDIFDLALVKQLSSAQQTPINPGDDVTFTLTIVNQGNVDAYNVEVTDFVPAGLTPNDTDWTDNGDGTLSAILAGPIVPGSSVQIDVTFTVSPTFGGSSITNEAEISSADDDTDPNNDPPVDVDSTPDDDNTNDGPETNDVTDGSGGDEDDSDPETIVIANPNDDVFDLALTKILSANQSTPIAPGDEVTFTITVFNQGEVDAYNVEVTDFVPAGLIENDPDWMNNNDGTISFNFAGPITAGSSVTVDVTFIVSPAFSGGSITNEAEISAADDDTDPNNDPPVDVDSTPDADNGNDGSETDDAVDGTGGDEDDSDPATINIVDPNQGVFDLALTKVLSVLQPTPIDPGDLVTFTITVYNQGEIDAYNVEITDFIPNGLIENDTDWTNNNDGTMSIVIPGPIAAGSSASVDATFIVNPGFTGTSISNEAEISAADNDQNPNNDPPVDLDSTPDADNTNDGPETNDDVNGADGDEDDSDYEEIPIGGSGAVLDVDLALQKVISSSQSLPVVPGDPVSFTITVFNQSNVDAYNVAIVDYIPAGLNLIAGNGWTQSGNTASTTIAGPVPAMGSISIDIDFVIDLGFTGNEIVNEAEIESMTDVLGNPMNDIDSTPDGNPNNDGTPLDNEINNGAGDEDDADFAVLSIDPLPCGALVCNDNVQQMVQQEVVLPEVEENSQMQMVHHLIMVLM